MKNPVTRLLDRWGGTVEIVEAEETVKVRAVLEPVASVSWQNMRRQMSAWGQIPTGQFLYVGPRDISGAEFLRRRGKAYHPRRCEEISLGGQVLFYWGLCVPVGEEAAWTRSLCEC